MIDNYYLDNNTLRRCHSRCKFCYSVPTNNEEMNCIECLNDEKNIYIYQNDTTNCILEREFIKRKNIVFTILQNYNFYIITSIFIISLIVGFIFFCCLCINGDIPDETNKNNEDDKNALMTEFSIINEST